MRACAIVEPLNVVEDVAASLSARLECEVVEPLGFDRVKEALGQSIVPAVAGAAHAAADSVAVEKFLVVRATVLRSAVAVMDKSRGRSPSFQSDPQRLKDQGMMDAIRRGPANDAAREDINDDRKEEPAFASSDLGDVGYPESIRRIGMKLPHDKIGSRGEIASPGRDEPEATSGSPAQAFQAHQPCDSMFAGTVSCSPQRLIDPRRSVDATVLAVHGMDPFHQLRILFVPLAVRALHPSVETATGDLQDAAGLAYREGLPLLFNESEFHFCSSAK